jgi:hypothetical protein
MLKKIINYALLFQGLILTGCVEHLITVHVHQDGKYKMHIVTKGDSTDVFDDDFPHPKLNSIWTSTQHKEQSQNSEEEIWTLETQGLLSGITLFTKDLSSFVPLQHPITVKREENWISTTYTVQQIFRGREVYRKYPKFGDSLQDSEKADSIQWLPEAMVYVCSQALNRLKFDTSIQLELGLLERIDNHLKNYFIHVETIKLMEELEQNRSKMLQTALSPFLQQLPLDFIQKMSLAMEPFAEEIRVTHALKDDHFQFSLVLPGMITKTNADSVKGDTLKWAFGLKDFLNEDKVIFSKSVIYSQTQFQKLVLFAILGICIFLIVLLKWYR